PNPEELETSRAKLRQYSEALLSVERIESEWERFCARNRTHYLFFALCLPYLAFRIARRLGIDRAVTRYAKFKRHNMLKRENMIRCEAHREALLDILEKDRLQ